MCCINIDGDSEIDRSLKTKTMYIDSTIWKSDLNSECQIKMKLTKAIYLALKVIL